MGEASPSYPQTLPSVPYSAASPLNTLSLHFPAPPNPNGLWLVYIHGGAWRDPLIDNTSIRPLQNHLVSSSSDIAAYASINYRLSPYPSHPSSPSTPGDPSRNAHHPDHITDILTALLYLQETYAFGQNYILVGHSCGATLALQLCMRRFWGSQYDPDEALTLNVEPPLAVVGAAGIYDIPGLVEEYASIPVYREIVANAFGSDEGVWEGASPVNGDFEEGWPEGRRVVLVASEDDELVSPRQSEAMADALTAQGWRKGRGKRSVEAVRLKGLGHDEIWQDGRVLAEVVGRVVEEMTT